MTAFTLLLTQSTEFPNTVVNLLGFANAAVQQGHKVNAIFCYQAGTEYANKLRLIPADEPDAGKQLIAFSQTHEIPLQVCISAANRRGVVSQQDAQDNGLDSDNLNPAFQLVGLGELAQHLQQSDRVIQF